jgi:hypothetical protein
MSRFLKGSRTSPRKLLFDRALRTTCFLDTTYKTRISDWTSEEEREGGQENLRIRDTEMEALVPGCADLEGSGLEYELAHPRVEHVSPIDENLWFE